MKRKSIFDVSICYAVLCLLNIVFLTQTAISQESIRAYCIDFNWGAGGAHGFAKAGHWSDADPKEHVQWYADLGCNVIQTFAVSCNGYAWYKNGIVPEQPGLKHDFLTETVKLGRQKKMKVFGYFCVGANNKWEQDHPDLCYQMDGQQIPLTQTYLDYLCASIEDAVKKTDMDGFMLDWFYNPGGGRSPLPKLRWLPCEQKMYQELMGEDFPGKEKITPEMELAFRRKSIERAWQQIKTATKKVKPNCIIWLTASEVNSEEYVGTSILKEVDWLMNEAGDSKRTQEMKELSGSQTKLITCLANWNKQNPLEIVPVAVKQNVGIYGFTKPTVGTLPPPISHYLSKPVDNFKKDDLNIAVLARVFNNQPIDYVTPLTAAPVVSEKRVQELKDLRWGMFICWSFSTFSGREWTGGVAKRTDYDKLFPAKNVDTDQWAKTAKDAGMGYILFLTKHHDGFCLWDTKTTDRKVTNAPLGKDVLAELRKSCDKYGIKLALYFSEGDWTWEGAVDGKAYEGGNNPETKKAQLQELLTNYGAIEYIWFDHAAGTGGLNHAETTAWCKKFQPDCFIGYNHGDQSTADIRLGEMGKPGPLENVSAAGPYMKGGKHNWRVAEFTYPILPSHKGGAMWFYSLQDHDQLVHPAKKLFDDYLGAIKYGNIFSIDVGPDYNGKLRDVDVKTLREVGELIHEHWKTIENL